MDELSVQTTNAFTGSWHPRNEDNKTKYDGTNQNMIAVLEYEHKKQQTEVTLASFH